MTNLAELPRHSKPRILGHLHDGKLKHRPVPRYAKSGVSYQLNSNPIARHALGWAGPTLTVERGGDLAYGVKVARRIARETGSAVLCRLIGMSATMTADGRLVRGIGGAA